MEELAEEGREGGLRGVSPFLAGGSPNQRLTRSSLTTLCLSHPALPKQNKKEGHVIADPNEPQTSRGSGSGRAAGGAPARASRAPESRPALAPGNPGKPSRAPAPAPTTDGALRLEGEVLNLAKASRGGKGPRSPGAARCRRSAPGQGSTARATGPATPPWPASLRPRLRGFEASDPGDLDSRKAGSSPGRRRTPAVRSRKLCSAR